MLLAGRGFIDFDPISQSALPGSLPQGPLRPVTFRTPVYPLVLAAFFGLGGGLPGVAVAQHILVVLFSMLMFSFLAPRFGDAIGFVAAVLFGMWPSVVILASLVLTETLSAVLVGFASAAFYVALRNRSVAMMATAGLLFGIATLTRPIVLYLPVVLIVVLLLRRYGARGIVAFAIASSILPAGWAVRNKIESGVATVASVDGENILMFRAAGTIVAKDMPPGRPIFALQQQTGFYRPMLMMRPALARQAIAEAVHDGVPLSQLNHARLSRYYARMGMRVLAAHPITALELSLSAFIELYFDQFASELGHGMNAVDARLRFVPVAVVLFALAVFGVVSMYRRDPDAGVTLAAILIYFSLISSGPEVEPRFIVPYCPLYATAIAAGAVALVTRLAERRRPADAAASGGAPASRTRSAAEVAAP